MCQCSKVRKSRTFFFISCNSPFTETYHVTAKWVPEISKVVNFETAKGPIKRHNICHNILATFVVSRCWDRLTTSHNNVAVLWHVVTSLNYFKLCLNIFTTFLLFLKSWEVVVAVWPTCHNKLCENVVTNIVTVWSGLKFHVCDFKPGPSGDASFEIWTCVQTCVGCPNGHASLLASRKKKAISTLLRALQFSA